MWEEITWCRSEELDVTHVGRDNLVPVGGDRAQTEGTWYGAVETFTGHE